MTKAGQLLESWIANTRAPSALRGPLAGADVFQHLARITRGAAFDYELQEVPIDQASPTQTGEDYLNESSRYLAEKIRSAHTVEDLPRRADVLPILLDVDGFVRDGNHRHAAAMLNAAGAIPALVPVREGTGRILNIPELAQ
jgi:hypothetical protein